MSDISTPRRLQPHHIEDFLSAITTALWTAHASERDLRIAQIVGNLGDRYYMEDAEYVAHVRSVLAAQGLCRP